MPTRLTTTRKTRLRACASPHGVATRHSTEDRRAIAPLLAGIGRTLLVTLGVLACGCQSFHQSKLEVVKAESAPDPALAKELHQKGLVLLRKEKSQHAEKAFQEAIAADPRFGPAHNNLGLLQFGRRELHAAAWSFQRAIDLMPGRPEPLNNLGLTLEAGGRADEALAHFESAHRLEPNNPEYLGNMLRVRVRGGEPVADLAPGLQQLLFLDTRPDWIEWAEEQLALFSQPASAGAVDAGGDPNSASRTSVPEIIPTPAPQPQAAIPDLQGFFSSGGAPQAPRPNDLIGTPPAALGDLPEPPHWPSKPWQAAADGFSDSDD
ncbi:MAG: tetratricopeptide repeat protein [Planctomycetota bacterium]